MNNIVKGLLACTAALFVQWLALMFMMQIGAILIIITLGLGLYFIFQKEQKPIGVGLLCCVAIDIVGLIIIFNDFSR
jgi:hypothetical protein